MKLKRLWRLLSITSMTAAVGLMGCGFAACNDEHIHTFSGDYIPNGESGHYQKADCGHDNISDVSAHKYDDNYKCTVCGYQHEHTYSAELTGEDDSGHYHSVTCGHNVTVTKESHVYDGDYVCTECSYEHEHIYSETAVESGDGHIYAVLCGHDTEPLYEEHSYAEGVCSECGAKDPEGGEDNKPDNPGDNDDKEDPDNPGDNDDKEDPDNPGDNDDKDDPDNPPSPPVGGQTFTGKIYVVGDSTVCSFNDNYYIPRYGYGTQLYQYFNVSEDQVVNLALSGRSSLSFTYDLSKDPANKNSVSGTMSCYEYLLDNISAGDYLVIGFGHNDEKTDDPLRFSNPNNSYTEEGSFQYNLYTYYISVAQKAGATPILCTPIVRYNASHDYSGSSAHIVSGVGDYPEAIRKLGKEVGVTVIDLTALTKADYIKNGDEAKLYHAYTTYSLDGETKVPAGIDNTHINKFGAMTVAYYFANAISTSDSNLRNYLKTEIVKPTYENDFESAVNANYKKPDYNGFDPSKNTSIGKVGGVDWYKTAMGEIGGASKIKNFTITATGETIEVGNKGNLNGKFTATADGFAAAFIQVDASKNFKISATAKVVSLETNSNSQSAFGIMLRDDIYVDLQDSTILSNYIAAGGFVKTNGAIFCRQENELILNTNNKLTVAAGNTFEISIERASTRVTANFGNYSLVYTDFDLVAVDNDYMYLCLFANRGLVVEFSDISFEITGESSGA